MCESTEARGGFWVSYPVALSLIPLKLTRQPLVATATWTEVIIFSVSSRWRQSTEVSVLPPRYAWFAPLGHKDASFQDPSRGCKWAERPWDNRNLQKKVFRQSKTVDLPWLWILGWIKFSVHFRTLSPLVSSDLTGKLLAAEHTKQINK